MGPKQAGGNLSRAGATTESPLVLPKRELPLHFGEDQRRSHCEWAGSWWLQPGSEALL